MCSQDIYWPLMQLAVRIRHDVARQSEKRYGLPWIQLHTLCLLQPGHPLPMHELSGQMACDASNITGIIDRLSANGYAKRQDDPHDRRIKLIVLTKKGVAVRQAILQDMRGINPEGIDALTPAERSTLHLLLEKVLVLEPKQNQQAQYHNNYKRL